MVEAFLASEGGLGGRLLRGLAAGFVEQRGAALAAHWTQGVIVPETREYLDKLEPSNLGEDVGLFHASPRDPVWEYVLSPLQAEMCLDIQTHRICLIGHSHVALSFSRADGESATGQTRGPDEERLQYAVLADAVDQLAHRLGVEVLARLVRVPLVEILVIILGAVELGKRDDLGDDRRSKDAGCIQFLLVVFRQSLLLVVVIKDHRAILCSEIIPLPVFRGRVVRPPEHLEKLRVRDDPGVESDLD